MNVFFRIGDKLITAPVTDTILDGVTRKSIIQIAKDFGIDETFNFFQLSPPSVLL